MLGLNLFPFFKTFKHFRSVFSRTTSSLQAFQSGSNRFVAQYRCSQADTDMYKSWVNRTTQLIAKKLRWRRAATRFYAKLSAQKHDNNIVSSYILIGTLGPCQFNQKKIKINFIHLKVLAIAQRYKSDVSDPNVVGGLVLKSTSTTFYLLVDLMSFFDVYHTENWDLAYDTLNRLNTLPSTTDNIDAKIKQFIAFTEEVESTYLF